MTETAQVRQKVEAGVLVLAFDAPPMNALGAALRAALAEGLDRAQADAGISAVVIRSEVRGFSSGLDPAELGGRWAAPDPGALCRRIETFAKPVVVAMRGSVLGAGLDLALAAHLRLATPEVRLGYPEVASGLVPAGGGTQRLPRLIGAEQALRMLLGGQTVGAAEALAMGMLDRVVEADLPGAAVSAAAALAAPPVPTADRREGLRDARAFQAAVAAARAAQRGNRLPAPDRLIACVEAALLLPFEQGLEFEAAAFDDLKATPESAGLRHVQAAERRAHRLPRSLAATTPGAVGHLGLWAAGAAGAELAGMALKTGLRVTLAEPDRAGLVAALEHIATAQQAEVAAGRLSEAARDADWARLTPAGGPEALDGADLVIHSGGLPAALAGVPALSLGRDGAMGLHPALAARFAEVWATPAATPGAVVTALALLRRLGLRTVLAGARTGPGAGIGARVAGAGAAALAALAARGVPAAALGRAAAAAGLAVPEAPAGVAPDAMPEPQVAARVLAAMANAGAQCLAEGAARRPSDIDLVMVVAQGFPRWLGGPMFQADQRGLLVLRRDLRLWQHENPVWAPAPLLDVLIGSGRGFEAFNGG